MTNIIMITSINPLTKFNILSWKEKNTQQTRNRKRKLAQLVNKLE